MGSELLDTHDINGAKVNFKKIPDELRKLIGYHIKIIKGNWKGYYGTLKRVTDRNVSIELDSRNKHVIIDLDGIQDVKENGYNNFSTNRVESTISTPRSNFGGAKTPAYYPQSPTFNPTSPKWNNPSSTRNIFFIIF